LIAKCALLTMTYNEPDFLAMWYQYYSKHFADGDIYILDDGSDDGYFDGIGGTIEKISEQTHPSLMHEVKDCHFKTRTCSKFVDLLGSYRYVMKVDTDEFVVPDPEIYPDGLSQYIHDFKDDFAQCSGYNVLDTGQPLDVNVRPWLNQRTHWHRDWHHYCKVVLANQDPKWGGGFHNSQWNSQWKEEFGPHERRDFRLLHLHYVCGELTFRRWEARRTADNRFNPVQARKAAKDLVDVGWAVKEEIPEKWRQAL